MPLCVDLGGRRIIKKKKTGLLIAIFVGFVVDKKIIDSEMLGIQPKVALIWRFALRYLAPLAIGAVFIMGFYDKFF